MYNKYNIGNYYLKDSIIHKLNPVAKIISLLLSIITTILANNLIDFIILFIFILTLMLFSKIEIKLYLKNIYTLRIFIIFIIIINLIFKVDIIPTIYMILKIIYLVILSAILTLTTPPTEITYGLERILRIFNKILPVNSIALSITLSLRFIPLITMQAERIIKAGSLRGLDFKEGFKSKIKSISNLFIPMLYLSFKKADDLAEIMELRLYNYGLSRTNYRLNETKTKDIILLILNIVILIVVTWR